MARLLDTLQAGYSSFAAEGQFLMLFMVALLFLYLSGGEKNRQLVYFSTCMLFLLLFPVTARLLLTYQTQYYLYEHLWQMLPVTVLLAYALVAVFFGMTGTAAGVYDKRRAAPAKGRIRCYEGLTVLAIALLLGLCGTLHPFYTVTFAGGGEEKIPRTEHRVLSEIMSTIPEDGTVTLLAPAGLMTWARIADGAIILPYGRDLWEPELTGYSYEVYDEMLVDIHNWINGIYIRPQSEEDTYMQDEILLSYCETQGYDYIVFDWERIYGSGADGENRDEALCRALDSQSGYSRWECGAGEGRYVIYSRR